MIKIGNASGFWGDDIDAPRRLVQQQPDLDYLTLDYLAEISLSIMAIQQERDSSLGYAKDFVEVIKSLIPAWKNGASLKVITNAGGLNPIACTKACLKLLKEAGLPLKVAGITGDNVFKELQQDTSNPLFKNLETGLSLHTVSDRLVTANAYIGAYSIAEALTKGADIVIGGRIADPSLTVGPCLHHFKWKEDSYSQLAAATIAGHLIECGTQATGGIATDWLDMPDPANLGYPVIEIEEDGHFVITKPSHTGGRVDERTVKEQLIYEIGDPSSYLSPDVTVSFLNLKLKDLGSNRVLIEGADGRAATDTYKVSAVYREGFKAEAFLTLFGRDVLKKAKRAGELVYQKVKAAGYELERFKVECLGSGDVAPGVLPKIDPKECVLRMAAADKRKEALEYFAKEIAPLVTNGPQGTTGYSSGRPKIRPLFGYWPCLISKKAVTLQVTIYE